MTTDNTTELCRDSDTVHGMVGKCGSCRFFLVQDEPWRRDVYSFIGRLSEQEGRHVALGYCIRRDKGGEGPRADADTCQHYEAANNSLTGREPATGEAYRAGVGSALIHPSERKP